MVSRGALVVRYVGDTRDITKANKQVSKGLGGVATLAKGLALGVGAVAVGVAAVAGATAKDLMRVQRLGAQTNAVIKATGGAAGRTRSQVDRLAGRLEKMTGAEAEAVTEGQNMLLTFKNIKGKQFDLATKSMLDMGVAMNKGSLEGLDLSKTSIQMGKALNDPIKGITALSKVGVSFSDQQKKQIKRMQEAGDMAGAQGVILKELQGEFGGAAKAAGQTAEGMIAKIKNTFGNIAESTLAFVLPMLMTLMGWVQNKVMPVLARFGEWLSNDGAAHLRAFGGWLKTHVLPPLKDLGGFIGGTVVPNLVALGKWMARNRELLSAVAVGLGVALAAWKAYVFFTSTVPAIIAAVTAAQKGLNLAMRANVIGIVITAIAALVGALVWFFTKTKLGQKIVTGAWAAIQRAIKAVTDWWTNTAWPAFKRGLTILGMAFRAYLTLMRRIWVDGVWGTLKKVGTWIREKVFGGMIRGMAALIGGFRSTREKVAGSFSSLRDRLGSIGSWIREKVFGRIRTGLTVMKNSFRIARDGIARIWDGLKAAAAKPVNFLIKWVWNSGLRKVLNAIPGVELPEVKPVKFAKGGPVRGGVRGKDSVRAWLMPGEEVWTAKEVRAAGGHGVMKQMRQAVLKGNLNGDPKFAKGGSLSAEDIARAQSFARKQSGKPYGWGAVGPSAYDCSGFMSAITNVLQGQSPYRRRGATGDFPWTGFKKGPGQFTIGSTPNYAGSGVGHMAGNLGGLGVESRGGRGVILGAGAMPPTSSRFSQKYHLGTAGGSGSNWWDNISSFLDAMRKLPGQIREMMSSGSWITGFLRKMVVAVSANVAKFVNDKIPGSPIKPVKLASGAYIKRRPGGIQATIGEGRYDEVVAQVRPGGGGSGSGPVRVVLEINSGGHDVDDMLIKILRRSVKARGGNVQLAIGRG